MTAFTDSARKFIGLTEVIALKIILRKSHATAPGYRRRLAGLRIQMAFRPFGWFVDAVSVGMKVVAGPDGKGLKNCKLFIHTVHGGMIVESATSRYGMLAINQALRKAMVTLRHTVEQLRAETACPSLNAGLVYLGGRPS